MRRDQNHVTDMRICFGCGRPVEADAAVNSETTLRGRVVPTTWHASCFRKRFPRGVSQRFWLKPR